MIWLVSFYFDVSVLWHEPALKMIEMVMACRVIVFSEIDHIKKFQFQYEIHIRCIVVISPWNILIKQ